MGYEKIKIKQALSIGSREAKVREICSIIGVRVSVCACINESECMCAWVCGA